jgi:hypothetical protein
MTAIAVAIEEHSVWNCKWSRPGRRLSGVADRDQPESTWVCVRSGARHDIAEQGCDRCPYWEPDGRPA